MPKPTATEELNKIYRAMAKLKNNLHRADLDYTCQVSINTATQKITYAVSMTAPAEGLAPIMFLADTAEDLLTKIKTATKHINYDEVEKAYHRAQIVACENTIKGHEERLQELDLPEEERGEKVKEPTKELKENGSKESKSEVSGTRSKRTKKD